jgi:hypothetical protein
MNKELQGLLLCIAALGLAYTVLMLILMLFTGAKLIKTIAIVFTLSTLLFTLGLSKDIRIRIKQKLFMAITPKSSHYSTT